MTPFTMKALTWAIAAVATSGVIIRPFRLPEAIWAGAGATLLIALGLMPLDLAVVAIGKGTDVYFFLIGMMLLSETARLEGLFDWVAAIAVNAAGGSAKRLFLLVYLVGVAVTVFLSNDATAVVLTPAVFAAARAAETEPLPFLFVCATVANAASFVLPISNPANLVLYGHHMPPLLSWLARFGLPSMLSLVATYAALRLIHGAELQAPCAPTMIRAKLSRGGWTALAGIGLTAATLLSVSALDIQLGLPTFISGVLTTLIVLIRDRAAPWPLLKSISWAVIPLVAGLFVLVEALTRTGVIAELADILRRAELVSEPGAAAAAGGIIALAGNLMNNLPAGLIAQSTLAEVRPAQSIVDALLIGVDLGPNLSITGSLATILWLRAIRREGQEVGFWQFLKIGAVTMPPALILATGARLLID